ncbi:PPE family protein [Mycobacterium simiae]|uniref:PPE family protein n=1 Tax=Mycobacterium simiae TaxID=1784 RepID=UPI0026C1A0D1
MLDFVVLCPEVNSGRMYAGVGSGPLHAAAAGWEGLAADLAASAESFSSVISSTTSGGSWRGVGASAMTAQATPYVSWLHATAAAAGEAAAAVRSAAGAFESARAATVHPEAVAANRTLLANLVASNVLGLNSAAIAATEAQYGQMWAQDVAAMAGYQAAVQAVSERLAPFTAPPSKGGATPTTPVVNPSFTPTGSGLTPTGGITPTGGHGGSAAPPTPGTGGSGAGGTAMSMVASLVEEGAMTGASMAMMPLTSMMGGGATAAPADTAAAAGLADAPALAGVGAGLGAPVSAGLGSAHPIGGLSVPPSWAAPIAAEAGAGVPALAGGVGANAVPAAGVTGAPMGGMPMMPMGGAGAPMAAAAGAAGMPGAGGAGRGWPIDASRSSVVPRLGVG